MNEAFLELARGLELACRQINAPFDPLPAPIPLADLDLERADLRRDDPRLAYRYLRGLEIPGAPQPGPQAKPIWAAERGLVAPLTVVAEVQPGILATGDGAGVVRLFVRAGRARWECAAALPTLQGPVRDLCALEDGGFVAACDYGVVVHRRADRGEWVPSTPGSPAPVGTGFSALCRLPDGTVIAGNTAGGLMRLDMLPAGDWVGVQIPAGDLSPIAALAPFGRGGFCIVQARGAGFFLPIDGGTRSLPAPAGIGRVTDVTPWGEDVLGCTEAGELVLFHLAAGSDGLELVEGHVERVSTVPVRTIRTLDSEHIITWSDDQQVRVWARRNGAFALHATLPSVLPSARAVAGLSDGRVALMDTRGLVTALPQPDGSWRVEEIISGYELPVVAVAPLDDERIAFARGTALYIAQLTESGVGDVVTLELGMAPVTSLVTLNARTVVAGTAAGQLFVVSGVAEQVGQPSVERLDWTVSLEPEARTGPVVHLAAAGGILASADFDGHIVIWAHASGQVRLRSELQLRAPLSALALDGRGRLAAASGGVIHLGNVDSAAQPAPVPGLAEPGDYVALHWDDDDLLAMTSLGELRRIAFEPAVQVEPRFVWAGAAGARFAVLHAGARGAELAVAAGSRPVMLTSGEVLLEPRSDVLALVARDARLYICADALYVFDLSRTPLDIRRIVVEGAVTMAARLNRWGAVRSVVARRRDGQPWLAANVGGRSAPADPLLHPYLAVVEASGQLGEVFTSSIFAFTNDGRDLQIEDPLVPPD